MSVKQDFARNFGQVGSVESGEGTDMAMTMERKAQINMTPMIDVLLVLIIIFKGDYAVALDGVADVGAATRARESGGAGGGGTIVISVGADGAIRLNQEAVKLADLGARLTAIFRAAPEHVLFVRGEKGLEYRAVAEVVDIASAAGLRRVALMTE